MMDAAAQLGVLANEWDNNNHVPEVDWARMHSLDFQEHLNRRNTLVKRLEGLSCVLCEEFVIARMFHYSLHWIGR
jgi:antiviral helicase SKI2